MSLFRGVSNVYACCIHLAYILHRDIYPVNAVENIFHGVEMIFMFPEKSK